MPAGGLRLARRRLRSAAVAAALLATPLALAAASPPPAEGALTGGNVVIQLEAAQRAVAERASGLPDSRLPAVAGRLGTMAEALRKAIGKESGKRLDKVDDEEAGQALRGRAAALLVDHWLLAAKACTAEDATVLAEPLHATITALADTKVSGKADQPAVDGVLALPDNRPVFALSADARDARLALNGVNLHDPACDNPRLVATDTGGTPMAVQPVITGLSPTRIEMTLPPGLVPGPYQVRLRPMRKTLLRCSAQKEVVVSLLIVPPPSWEVAYTVTPTCRSGAGRKTTVAAQTPATGALPTLTTASGTVSASVELPACDDPVDYTLAATIRSADGRESTIGPITQSAAAGITAGVPGGLSLRWDPMVRQLFLGGSGNRCAGYY